MLKLENVSKYYYSKDIIALGLSKVDLEFHVGEFVAITGESGSGKSTLLNVLSGLDTYELGKMYINGEDISHYTVKELEEYRREYVGFVFQNYNIVDSYTVLQNVEMALTVQGYDKRSRKERALELIEKVGLSSRIHHKASKLSGGEKQRTVIARALAKDCKILVCDEPTGNLDTENAKIIFQLLHQISKDKLVIVVTHNYAAVSQFVTRKIRLFDGEVVEDKTIVSNKKSSFENISKKTNRLNYIDVLRIAVNNIISVPKRTIFSTFVTIFIIATFVFSYGSNLKQRNTSTVFETPYFNNSNPSRLVITKYNQTAFTDEEIAEISDLEYVRDVILYDVTLDTILTSKFYNDVFGFDEFIDYKVMSVKALNFFDLSAGKLPIEDDEVVIVENEYYHIGDQISLSNAIHIKKLPGETTLDYTFTVVGTIPDNQNIHDETKNLYFTTNAIETFKFEALFKHNQMFINLDDLFRYVIYQEVRIDDTLEDYVLQGYDAMFYDMCLDFNLEACVVSDFILEHDFSILSISRFENESGYVDVEFISVPYVEGAYGQAIYMNRRTFESFLSEDVYQPSVVVYDMFEAKQVKTMLEEMGYNVFYPNGVVTVEEGLLMIIRNIQLFLTLIFTMVVVYFIGYFVMRNVMISKKKDYLIYRSVGASKLTINQISITEIMIITIFSFSLLMSLLLINERFDTFIPRLLRYFEFKNYAILLVTIFILMLLMGRRFNKKIFDQSVVSSLREMI